MGMTSAAEAKLDARIRPEIAALRSRTSYPRRARARAVRRPALAVLPGGAEAGHRATVADASGPAGQALAAAAVAAAVAVARTNIRQAAARPARAGEAVSGQEASGRPAGPEASSRAVAAGRRGAAPGRAAVTRATAGSRVSLTRRGKVVAGVLVALAAAGLAALAWFAVAGQAQAAGPGGLGTGSGAGHTMLRVVVRPGETLWSIAVRMDPGADPRAVIQDIVDDNALRGTAIQAGQVLWVPRQS